MVNYDLDVSNDSDNSDDSDYLQEYSEDYLDDLYLNDIEHSESEKETFKYYIGITKLIKPDYHYLLVNSISSKMFFKYSFRIILKYLAEYGILQTFNPQIDILKLIIIDNTYTVIKKTFWIRIIQRTWKKVLLKRSIILLRRRILTSQRMFEITGRYPDGLNVLPGLCGFLSNYK